MAKATRKRELKGRRSGEERRIGEAVGSGQEDRNIVDKGDTESNAYTTDKYIVTSECKINMGGPDECKPRAAKPVGSGLARSAACAYA